MTIDKDNSKRCSRCTLPDNFRNIRFDKDGVCNFCHNHDEYIGQFRRFPLAEKIFLEQVEENRGRYQYDCAVGLSGGKDSIYNLYKIVNDYHLKVLAITFDNDFQSEAAENYIRKVVDDLHVDHVVLRFDRGLHYDLYKQAAVHLGWPCIACSFLGLALAQRYCFDQKIPLFVHARARNQMLREISKYSHDSYLPYYPLNYRRFNFEENLHAVKSIRRSLDKLMSVLITDKPKREAFKSQYFLNPEECQREKFIPQFVAYFLMHDYHENEIIAFTKRHVLNNESGRLKEYHHFDCLAHPAFMYIYKKAYGWSLLELEIAFDVRDGKISRNDAIQRIENEEEVHKIPDESFDLVCSKMNVNRRDLLDSLVIARKNIKRYKYFMKARNFFRLKPFNY